MSKFVNDNAVGIYFKNLKDYIDGNVSDKNIDFLKEVKVELLYLLLKDGQSGGGKLSRCFIQHCNDSINYCNLLESKILLSEGVNNTSDPTYEQMVSYIKSVFGDDVDEFDLNGGIYYFASHYYDGQFSNLYRAMNQTGYKPGAMSKEPVPFKDYEYTYLLYNIKYDIDDVDLDTIDYDDVDDDLEGLPDSMRFVVKKSEVMQDGGGIDRDDLEGLMAEYISETTGYLVVSYEFRLISSNVIEGDNDVMNAVYRALINKFASVSYDVGGKHDDLPPGEHYDLPPGIKENKTNMNENTISISEVKSLINQVISETLQQEIGAIDPNDYEPLASKDDVAADHLNDLTDTVNQLIKQVETETGDYDKAYDRLVKIYKQLTNAIDNPRLSDNERKDLEHDYEGILGNIHRVIGGGGGGSEKMYVAENDVLDKKFWKKHDADMKKIYQQLNKDAKNKNISWGDPNSLTKQDKKGYYYKVHKPSMQKTSMKKKYDLSECGSWEEAVKHPMFKEAVLTEKAPPGYSDDTMHRIKNSLRSAHPDWSLKKIISVAFAAAWKMFYKNKNK